MNCQEVRERLDDLVDGSLSEGEAELIARHMAGCEACSREAAALRGLLAQAAALDRSIPPQEELWGRIAERIAGGCARPERGSRSIRVRWLLVPAAALALVVFAVTLAAPHREGTMVTGAVSPAPLPLWETDTALADCVRAGDGLLGDFDRESKALDPDLVDAVRHDLRVIDGAAAETRSALAADPENERLKQTLIMVYEKRAGLLAGAVRLAKSA